MLVNLTRLPEPFGEVHALAELAEFVGVQLVPYFVEGWVLAELVVLERLAGGFVEDGKGPFVDEGSRVGAAGGGAH